MLKISLRDLYERVLPFLLPFFLILVMSTLFMGSSPLFQTNPWDDSNAMLTMGRSIQEGLIPFVDIVEQRGPFIYFLYAIGAGISSTSFMGVFLIELVNITLIYYFATRLARMFTTHTTHIPWLALLAPLTLLGTPAFRFGGSPEEFAFTSVMYLLVVLTESHGRFSTIALSRFFWLGLNLGFIFWNKYSLVGTFAIFFLLCGFYLLYRRQWLRFVQVVAMSLLGFFVAALPIFIYYIAVGHLDALFNIYFIQNLTSYHVQAMSVMDQLTQLLGLIWLQVHNHWFGCVLMVTSWIIASRKGHNVKIEIILAGGSIVFVALQKVVYIYYPLVWLPFMAIAVIRLIAYSWDWLLKNKNWTLAWQTPIFIALACVILPFFGNPAIKSLVPTTGMASLNGTTYHAQPQFGELMQAKHAKPSLLTLNCIDAGFFLSGQTVPVTPYYHRMNMSYNELPIMYDTFKNAMEDRAVDYTVVRVRHALTEDTTNAARKKSAVDAVNNSLKTALANNYHVVDAVNNTKNTYFVLLERNVN